jgi:glycosyltransferase involved in cell wall biosynthesis
MSARLRIALLGPLRPYRGGIAHFGDALHRGLEARGHEVAAFNLRRQYPSLLFPGRSQYVDDASPESGPPRVLDSVNPLSWRSAGRAVAQSEPDAVVIPFWMPFFGPSFGTLARVVKRGSGAKVVALVHNALPHEPRPGDRALSRYFLRAVDACIVLSEAVERDLRALGFGGPIRRVAHPVYEHFGEAMPRAAARAKLGLDAGAPTLLFFGFVRRYKGLHVLLDALPAAVERLPNVRLVVAGEFYDDEAPYRAQVERHGLAQHVRFVPDYIPEAEVGAYFSAADLVVQPYVTATQSGVAQIAFHFERPLVVTDVGGLAEIVPHGEAGLVVPPEDPEALASAIVRFFEDDLGEALTAGVRRERPKYEWARVYEAVEALARG